MIEKFDSPNQHRD